LGYLSYLIPSAIIKTESINKLVQKIEVRSLANFNIFLKNFEFLKFKDDSLIIDFKSFSNENVKSKIKNSEL
jgi:hypothetical protein